MIKRIILGIILLVSLSSRLAQSQGTTTYLSNLGGLPGGSLAVGSDSWVGNEFTVGTNPGGYLLNSVQLGMASASGNPGGFTATLDAAWTGPVHGGNGGQNLIIPLTGSADPAAAGIYTYTPPANLTLTQNYLYGIVVTAGTPVANGSYQWLEAVGGLRLSNGWNSAYVLSESTDGLSWNPTFPGSIYPEFAINATAVPEPAGWGLFGMGIVIAGGWRKISLRTRI